MVQEQFGKAFADHQADQQDREVSVVLTVAGKDITFYEPTGGQVMAMSMLASNRGNMMVMAQQVSGLLLNLMDEEGQEHFRAALMHWSEPLPPDALAAIVHRLTEEWTARPTEPQPESSPPALRDGTSSTATSRRARPEDRKPKAASSTSRRSVSAT